MNTSAASTSAIDNSEVGTSPVNTSVAGTLFVKKVRSWKSKSKIIPTAAATASNVTYVSPIIQFVARDLVVMIIVVF